MLKLTVHNNGKCDILPANNGETIYEALGKAGIFMDSPCGGRQKCGKCLCHVTIGAEPASENEKRLLGEPGERDPSLRLACFAKLCGDCEVILGGGLPGDMKIKVDGAHSVFAVQKRAGLKECDAGFAVDIGTTTLVAFLHRLSDGTRLGFRSGMNAQRAHGADVISRITYCMEEENGRNTLTESIRGQLNGMFCELMDEAGLSPKDIGMITIAGNTTMELLFAGLSPEGLAAVPFIPASLFGTEYPAQALGLCVHPEAPVYILPAVSGYVGGDITAAAIASGIDRAAETALLIDIGTNGEMVLGNQNGLCCCATAAGPAFEGADISCGMGGIPGAISTIRMTDGTLRYEIIGNIAPKGICGSGLVDALAMMIETGAVDETGRLLPPDEAPEGMAGYLEETEDGVVFHIDRDSGIFITARDIRKLQLAKAAVAAGVQTLLSESGFKEEDVHTLYIAGGFGSFIDKANAAKIGLFPKSMLPKVKTIGNAAGAGAVMTLLNTADASRIRLVAAQCKYVELSGNPAFMDAYVDQMMFE